MQNITLYHNPRCSKSRQALALLQQHGVEPTVVRYLEDPLSTNELAALFDKLACPMADFMRQGEAVFKEYQLGDDTQWTQAQRFAFMAEYPIVMERPIAVCGDQAVIGRPPENVLALLDHD